MHITYERELKDSSKKDCYAGKQWFLSGTRLEDGPVAPVSNWNWTYIFLITTKFVFEPPMFLF